VTTLAVISNKRNVRKEVKNLKISIELVISHIFL